MEEPADEERLLGTSAANFEPLGGLGAVWRPPPFSETSGGLGAVWRSFSTNCMKMKKSKINIKSEKGTQKISEMNELGYI